MKIEKKNEKIRDERDEWKRIKRKERMKIEKKN